MKISSLRFKTIQSLVSTVFIAGGISSCCMDMENRGMDQEQQKKKAKPIEQLVFKSDTLTDEDLKNFLGVDKGLQDSEGAKGTHYIESLNFNTKSLTSLSALAISCCNFKSLYDISLAGNKIGNSGCKYLSKLEAPKLEKLDLELCEISSIGMDHLSKALWKALINLNLGQNYFHNEGIKSIARAIYKLETLSLFHNNSNLDIYATSRVLFLLDNSDLVSLTVGDIPNATAAEEVCIENKFPNIGVIEYGEDWDA